MLSSKGDVLPDNTCSISRAGQDVTEDIWGKRTRGNHGASLKHLVWFNHLLLPHYYRR